MRKYALIVFFALLCSLRAALYAGQIPSHIYTGDNIRSGNQNIEKYISAAPEAYLAGSNGPDISNIMHYLTTPSIGAESHYEKTGDLTIALLDEADTDEAKAFALGWLTHWVNDYFIHPLVNQWGGWFDNDDTRHKSLEMLENKYVFSAKQIKKYNPETIPAAMDNATYDAVYQAFKKTYPNKSQYTSSDSRTNFLLWFRQANGHIRDASQYFMEAADNGTGKSSGWITWAAFPYMPTEKQYQDIKKFAEVKEVTFEKGKMVATVKVYDNKLHNWFLKQWDEAQVSATQYSKQVCDLAARYLAADAAQRDVLRPQLQVVLPNVSIDQPRNDFDNSKIYPGNVSAKEVYYECTITDRSKTPNKVTVVSGKQPIDYSGNPMIMTPNGSVGVTVGLGFDGARDGDVKLEIPVNTDTYKYDLKVSFMGQSELSDNDLKGYVWVGSEGTYGTNVKIDGDKSTKAGAPLKLKAVLEADVKTKSTIKLRWKDETAKTALGNGDSISFVSLKMGKFPVKVEAYGTVDKKEVVFAEDTVEIEVTEPEVKLSIDASKTVPPGTKVVLKAVITAEKAILPKLRCVWSEGKTPLGDGNSITYTTREEKLVKINIVVRGNLSGKDEVFAEAVHEIEVKKGAAVLSGVTADLQGLKSEIAAGGSANIGAANFRNSSGPLITTETPDVVPSLNTRWQKDYQQKNPGIAQKDIPARPKNWGVDSLKVIWHATPEAPFTPKETINSDKTSVSASGKAGTEVIVWGDILQEVGGVYTKAGETAKGRFTVSKTTMTVELSAPKSTLKPGELVDVIAKVNLSGVTPPLKFVWTGEHGGSTADAGKVSFVSRKNGAYLLSVEVTDSKGQKGTASITLTVIGVTATLVGVPDSVVYGQSIPLSIKVDGLDKVQSSLKQKDVNAGKDEWVLTEIVREDDAQEWKEDMSMWWGNLRGVDQWSSATHGDTSFRGHWAHPSFPITVTASWDMPPTRVKPNSEVKIKWSLGEEGDGDATINLGADSQPSSWDKQKKINDDQGYCPTRGDIYPEKGTYRFTLPAGQSGDVKKFRVQTTGTYSADGSREFANQRRTFVYTYNGEKAVDTPTSTKIIWQSEPGITFNPASSLDMKTKARFDRMNKIKIWAEVQILNDGLYETVGETPQKEVTVVAPKFDVVYDPVQGKAQVGQEIKATVKTEPVVDPSLIDYAWSSPESSNRMPYQTNSGVIGFKLKDAKPFDLVCTAKVPTIGEVIGTLNSTFSASPYIVKAQVVGTIGPKPQIWKEGVGLVDVERSSYASDERVGLKATIEGTPIPSDLRWAWSVNEGSTLAGGATSKDATVTRHDTGTVEATVEARDKDGVVLGKASVTYQVTISADQLKKAKEKGGLIEVTLTSAKATMLQGESVKLTASAKGGTAPYVYTWPAGCKGQGASAVYLAKADGKQTITITVKDAKKKSATKSISLDVQPAGLNLVLEAGKTSLTVNESTMLKATITGGKAPYKMTWSPNIEGQGKEVRLTGADPGNVDVTLTVTDAKKKAVSKKLAFSVSPLIPTLAGIPEQTIVGSQVIASITYPQSPVGSLINAKPLPTIYWHTEPQLTMQVQQSDGPGNTLNFDSVGPVKIWGEIISRRGKLIGKTEVKICNVVAPTFSMQYVQMAQGYVSARLTVDPEVAARSLDFKWMRPTGGVITATNGTAYDFKAAASGSVDLLCIIRDKKTGQLVKEIKEQYTGSKLASQTGDNPKPDDISSSAKADDTKPNSSGSESKESIAAAQLEQARTLAANGKIEEAITIARKAEKVLPEKGAIVIVEVAKNAVNWGITSVTYDLDFNRGKQLMDIAVKLDPKNNDAVEKRNTVVSWEKNWKAAQNYVDQFNTNIGSLKIVSAENSYKEARSRIEGIPGSKPTALINDMSARLNKTRDEHTGRLHPKRMQTMDLMKNKSYGQARTVIDEVLHFKVVPELTSAQEKEWRDWLGTCDEKSKVASVTQKDPKTTSSGKETSTTKADAKPAKKGSILDDIIGGLDQIGSILDAVNGKKPADKPASQSASSNTNDSSSTQTGKPKEVVSIGNTGGCQFTDTATFKLDNAVNVTQMIIWYSWNSGENTVAYKLYHDGHELRSAQFTKGTTDTYQKQWGNGVDEPQLNLQAGTYVVKIANKRLGQNSGTGGNGMIRIITGGYLVPPSGTAATQTPQSQTKPVPSEPAPSKSTSASAPKPLEPEHVASLPSGWVTHTAGDVSASMPGTWQGVKSMPSDQGAWYLGDVNVPDVGFGLVRGRELEDGLSGIQVQSQADITISGLPARSYIGKAKRNDLTGWLIAMKTPRPDGRKLFFIGVSKQSTWDTYKSTLEKVIGTIKIGASSAAQQPKSAPAASKPAPAPAPKPTAPKPSTSSSKMVEATLTNRASENIHIFIDGDTFGEHNRLTPGQSRKVNIPMPSNGRIKFYAGRGGTVLTTKIWDGDPDDTNRVPKVTFDSSETLLITTSLK